MISLISSDPVTINSTNIDRWSFLVLPANRTEDATLTFSKDVTIYNSRTQVPTTLTGASFVTKKAVYPSLIAESIIIAITGFNNSVTVVMTTTPAANASYAPDESMCIDAVAINIVIPTTMVANFTSQMPVDNELNSSPSKLSSGVIGGIVGGTAVFLIIAVVAGVCLGILFYRKRYQGEQTTELRLLTADPRSLPDIEIKHKLGEGNFGQVFFGEWKGAPVALKKLNQSEFAAFAQESEMMAKLNHVSRSNCIDMPGKYRSFSRTSHRIGRIEVHCH